MEHSHSRVDAVLGEARQHLVRLSAQDAFALHRAGLAFLIDTRTAEQRAAQGDIPGAMIIDRTVLEWRLDPTCRFAVPEAAQKRQLIVLCRQGYSSSLAARGLQGLGLDATDVVGGVEAWLAAGLPTQRGGADVRR